MEGGLSSKDKNTLLIGVGAAIGLALLGFIIHLCVRQRAKTKARKGQKDVQAWNV